MIAESMIADTQISIQVGAPSARTAEGREPIRDQRYAHGALPVDRRGQPHMITREELGKRLTAGDDAGEPTLSGSSGGDAWNVFAAADSAMEPGAEMPHTVDLAVANDPPSVEDRLQVAGNDTALQGFRTCRAHLPPSAIDARMNHDRG